MNTEYDAIIIGSGPAGYECAKIVSQLKGRALIIEKDELGGTCTNYGCIPTKSLHASASIFQKMQKSEEYGILSQGAKIDFGLLMKRKEDVVGVLSRGVSLILKEHKVDVMKGSAVIKDNHTVVVDNREIRTKNIVIATGARPRLIKGISLSESVLTSKELLELSKLPESLIIVGGGYIGCEFGSIFSAFGSKVTIIEFLDRLVPGEDLEVSNELRRLMRRQGIKVHTGSKVQKIEGNEVYFEEGGKQSKAHGEKILISVGVEPSFDKIIMDKIGIKYENGISINSRMQTSVSNIYAVGDCTGKIMLAHYAYAQAEIAAHNIMGQNDELNEDTVPNVIFTIPEISSVGVRNSKLKSEIFRFAANGKARTLSEIDGFVKIYHENGLLMGFSCIGAGASELVASATLAIKHKIPLKEIKSTIIAHPTLSEAFKGAIGDSIN
ncbi:MAG TPA: dihydrolipoyl dehydrogenase [Candidatus Nanoarchaeia archaeon]|nr:dihydrolipoyl dehydrogenase [Candidatus Nanoarchaeia archaeon]